MNTQSSNTVSAFAALLAASSTTSGMDLVKGQILDGTYVGAGLVSCGTKCDHKLHSLDMEQGEPAFGAALKVIVTNDGRSEDEDRRRDFNKPGALEEGQCVVSAVLAERWLALQAAQSANETVTVRVLSPRRKGHNVVGATALFGGVLRGFIPRSHFRHSNDIERLVGQELSVKVKDVELQKGNVLFDLRAQVQHEAELREQRVAQTVRDLQIGSIVAGRVHKVIDCGALVDIGHGVCGLLHRTELVSGRTQPREGEMVEVLVIAKDEAQGRFSLSERKAQPLLFGKTAKVGDEFDGTIKNLQGFGVFVEIVPGVRGLLHRSRFNSADAKVGDRLRVKLLATTGDGSRVDLDIA